MSSCLFHLHRSLVLIGRCLLPILIILCYMVIFSMSRCSLSALIDSLIHCFIDWFINSLISTELNWLKFFWFAARVIVHSTAASFTFYFFSLFVKLWWLARQLQHDRQRSSLDMRRTELTSYCKHSPKPLTREYVQNFTTCLQGAPIKNNPYINNNNNIHLMVITPLIFWMSRYHKGKTKLGLRIQNVLLKLTIILW